MRLPLTLQVRRSRRLTAGLAIAHLMAAAGFWPVGLPPSAKIVVWCLLAVSLAVATRRQYRGELTLRTDGRVALTGRSGSALDCRVHPATTAFSWLILLLLDSSSGRIALTLPVDAIGDEGHRQLRTWLKWTASGQAA